MSSIIHAIIDEKKLTSIKQQLRQLALNDRNAKVSSTRGGDPYTGGIFCRIEAQFRVQRMMANGLPTGSSKLSSQSGYVKLLSLRVLVEKVSILRPISACYQ